MSRANPFNRKIVFGLIAAGVAGFALMILLLAFGSNMGSPRDGRAHAQSVAATGYKALFTLVGAFREAHILRDRDRLYNHLLVVSVEPQTSADELTRLLANRGESPTLIILPKWMTMPDNRNRGWVRSIGPGVPIPAIAALEGKPRVAQAGWRGGSARGVSLLRGLTVPVPASAQVIEGDGIVPLVPLGRGALVAQLGNRPHYVVADPDLLNNQGMRNPDTARAALMMLDALNTREDYAIDFDVTLNGFGEVEETNLLRTALEPPFLAMTIALLFAAILAGLHGAFRFGPAREEERAIAFGKAALVENSAGLIRLAKREANLGGAYADVIRQETARAANAPSWLQGEALDQYLDRMNREGDNFSTLAERLSLARDRTSLMRAARALFQWKKDTLP